jgi:hypothetical protein
MKHCHGCHRYHTSELNELNDLLVNVRRGSSRGKCVIHKSVARLSIYLSMSLQKKIMAWFIITISVVPKIGTEKKNILLCVSTKYIKLTYRKLIYRLLVCMYRMSHVPRNPPTGMRQLCYTLWRTHFAVVRSLLLRNSVVAGSTSSGTPCILSEKYHRFTWNLVLESALNLLDELNSGSRQSNTTPILQHSQFELHHFCHKRLTV